MSGLAAVMRRSSKWVSAGADLLRPPSPGVVVLLYHRVGARTDVEVDLPVGLFDQQMAELSSQARVVSLDRAAETLSGSDVADTGSVVITFDDGTADLVDRALPVLVRHGVPATIYVATRFVEEQRWFPDRGRPATWAGLAEAVSTGLVTVGSHTHSHRLLDRVGPAEAADELDRSRGLIEDRLGVAADHFAYPKALPAAPDVEPEVRARFRTAAMAGGGTNAPSGTDLHRLARSPVQVSDGLRWFRRKATGGLRLEGELRARRAGSRYSGAAT